MKLTSGFSEDQLDDLRGRLVDELDGGPELVQRILDTELNESLPRPYNINQVMHDLAGFCRVCSVCGYIVDAVLLDVDDICESCHIETESPDCGENDTYGFDDDDFDDDDDGDFIDEMYDFEGDDWDDDLDDE